MFPNSELLPLKEAIIKISFFLIAPKDPCPASVGSKVKLEIPIDDRVLDIFSNIFADLPTPQQITLPLTLWSRSIVFMNDASID